MIRCRPPVISSMWVTRAHDQPALAGPVGQLDLIQPQKQAAGREVRPVDELHQLVDRDILELGPSGRSGKQWRRRVSLRLCGGMLVAMPTAMPLVPLSSRLGSNGGQDSRLLEAAVEVVGPIRPFPYRCRPAAPRRCGQAGLGITHGRRASPSTEPKLP